MKVVYVLFLSLLIASTAVGQTQTQKPTAEKPVAQPAQKTTSNDLVQHFLRKYAVASRWGDDEVAKSALYDLIVQVPSSDSLIFTLAYFYYQNRQFAPAMLVSQELVNRQPKNQVYLELAASSYEEVGVLDRALQNYETLYLLTNDLTVLYKIAFLQFNLKRYSEGLTNADILLSKPEVDTLKVVYNNVENKATEYAMRVAVLNLKGMLAQENGDNEGARKLFQQALALAPDFLLAKQNLAKIK